MTTSPSVSSTSRRRASLSFSRQVSSRRRSLSRASDSLSPTSASIRAVASASACRSLRRRASTRPKTPVASPVAASAAPAMARRSVSGTTATTRAAPPKKAAKEAATGTRPPRTPARVRGAASAEASPCSDAVVPASRCSVRSWRFGAATCSPRQSAGPRWAREPVQCQSERLRNRCGKRPWAGRLGRRGARQPGRRP